MNSLAQTSDEFCPSCGNFVQELNGDTGWCDRCSGIEAQECLSCKKEFLADSPHRKLCPTCRDERWLARHADELELYLSYGARISFAKREVYKLNRPICIVCNRAIKGGANGSAFCSRTIECRRWQRRYRTLKEKYGNAKSALSEVSAEIFISQHKMEIKSD